MDIIPPRRRGQLGAFSVGGGTQSGGFKVQPGAAPASRAGTPAPPPPQSMSRQMATRAPGAPLRPGPSLSVSEQMEAQRKSLAAETSAKASQQIIPQSSKGDTFQNSAVVAVQGYTPPAATPEVTLPAKQPNENAGVTAAANQQPVTQGQLVQQVLARDAGILIPAAPAPAIPGDAEMKMIFADLWPLMPAERTLVLRILMIGGDGKKTARPVPQALPQWLRDWRRGIPMKELAAQIIPISAGSDVVRVELTRFLSSVKPPPPPGAQPIPVGATSLPPALPMIAKPTPPAAMSPAVLQTSTAAAGSIVGAKVAIAQANGLAAAAQRVAEQAKKLAEDKKRAEEAAKAAAEAAKAAAEKEKKAVISADIIIKSQTATANDKSEMEAKVRTAAEEAARAELEAAKKAEEAKRLEDEKKAAEEAAAKLKADAEAAKGAAEKKIDEANSKIVLAQTAEQAAAEKKTIELPDSALSSRNLVVIDKPKEDEKKSGMMPVLLGLVAVGAVVYAVRSKANLNGAPKLIELEDEE